MKEKINKINYGNIIFFIVMVIVFILYFTSGNETKQNDVIFKSYNEKFLIKLPYGWIKAKEQQLNEEADIEVFNKKKDFYLILLMENKEDLDYTYKTYVEATIEDIKESYDVSIDKTNIYKNKEDEDRTFYCFDFYHEKVKIYMCDYVVETKSYMGQLIVWTIYSQKEELDEFLKTDIVNEIKES